MTTFEKEAVDDIRALSKGYARGHGGLKLSTVSLRMYGNALVLEDFLAGKRSISFDKAQRMVDGFKADWPSSQPWPQLKRLF